MSREGLTLQQETLQINRIVAVILTIGMYSTIGFYVIGLALFLIRGGQELSTGRQYFHSFSGFFRGLTRLDPKPFLYLGTLSLILTPISRVFISIFAFWRDRDYKFVLVTLFVFLVIVASVVVGTVFKLRV